LPAEPGNRCSRLVQAKDLDVHVNTGFLSSP
jgi:hypothetical protein